ncbi:MAG TPA: hypothetical protein VNI52_04215 [Sphingobacteriaceae bacterium]|nr:hypothetical protein [Sphingobacteriaceae bacterium]
MKSFLRLSLLVLFLSPLLLIVSSCNDEVLRTRTYQTRYPVIMKTAEFRAQAISLQSPSEMSVPGRIYVYGDYLFINEVNKGIHIVDNTNPSSPKFLNFISIPGNNDLAVSDNIMYADNYVDLLAFDITNPVTTHIVKRVEDVFPGHYTNRAAGLFLTYRDTIITEVMRDDQSGRGRMIDGFFNSAESKQSYGQGGSMARFTLMNRHLYTVDRSNLRLFNIDNSANPKFISTIGLGWGIETIFPYQNKLFIGSNTGMHIYDAANPAAPVKLSTYSHFTSCDPVVVSGDYAYVTLRSGTRCTMGSNVLEVLDIRDLKMPKLVKSFPMQNPHGLGLSGSNLFICEGAFGLKSFNAANVLNIGNEQLQHIKNIKATDVITGPRSLIVTGADGIYQYDYTNAGDLRQLSHLKISKPAL